jgi:5-(carboxyamino)imidazole ribonucleotide synthase
VQTIHKNNILHYLLSPAPVTKKTADAAKNLGIEVMEHLNGAGVFGIEMFLTTEGKVLINEIAPRVHNSGHHTIEANHCSQYDMLWRIILGYPLGNTAPILPAAIINIIGAENYSGNAVYEGLEEVLTIDNAFVHLYGKKQTKPGRKMGHVTIMHSSYHDLTHKANKVKNLLKVKS